LYYITIPVHYSSLLSQCHSERMYAESSERNVDTYSGRVLGGCDW